MSAKDKEKAAGISGLGFGHDMIFTKRFSASAEVSSPGLYLGNFETANILNKGQLNLQLGLIKGIGIFAGPSYSMYHSDPKVASASGYKQRIGPASSFKSGRSTRGWVGWNFGITLF